MPIPFPSPPPGQVIEDLYRTRLPARVRVVHYRADTFGMDPSFAWELAPIDEGFLKALIRNAKLQRASQKNRPSASIYRWPPWWNVRRLDALPEVYTNEASGLRHVWVDRRANRLFVEFLGT